MFKPPALCLLLLLLASISAAAPPEEFSRFRAVDDQGQRIDGWKGNWDGSMLQGKTRDGQPIEIARENLKLLDVRVGSQAAKYAAIGGGIGGLLALAAALNVESDPDSELDTGRAVGIGAGAAFIGASIGALAGWQQSRWRNVELTPSTGARPGRALPFSFALGFDF